MRANKIDELDILLSSSQASNDWLQERKGFITASEFWKLLVSPKSKIDKEEGNMSETAKTYLNTKRMELMNVALPILDTKETRWGTENEIDAFYKLCETYEIRNCGFVKSRLVDNLGASPDGYNDEYVFEIKCPYNSLNHLENLDLNAETFKKKRWEYYVQMQVQMFCMELSKGIFCSFDPRFPEGKQIKIIEIEQDEEFISIIYNKMQQVNKLLYENT